MILVALIALAMLGVVHVVAHASARYGAARVLGVPGVRFVPRREAASDASFARRATVAASGIGVNYLLTVILALVGIRSEGEMRSDPSLHVIVAPGGPAAKAGIVDGDFIVAVDGEAVDDWASLRQRVSRQNATPIDVTFEREGVRHDVLVTPDEGRIRVTPRSEKVMPSFGVAIGRALGLPFKVYFATVEATFRKIALGEKSEVAGPVMIASEVAKAFTVGYALSLLATMSAYALPGFVFLALVGFPSRRRAAPTTSATTNNRAS